MKNESAISLQEIRELGTALPPPITKRVIGGIQFEVYQTKDLFRGEWKNDALRKLVIASRTSYQRWGDFQPLDRDDAKAVVYLVRLDYSLRGKLDGAVIEEWVSYRFVPAGGDPSDVEELSLFVCDGKPVMEAAKEILFGSQSNYRDFIVNSSRLCGIRPFFRDGEFEKYSDFLPSKHADVALGFAVINESFLDECFRKGFPFRYLFGIIRDELIVKALSVRRNGTIFSPAFTPAHFVLGVPETSIRLDRRALSSYAYRFPLYFLNNEELYASLEQLHLSVDDIGSLIRSDDGKLRDILDREVGDNPALRLKITSLPDRLKSIRQMIRAADH